MFEKAPGKDEHGRRLSNMSNQSSSSTSSVKLTLPIDFAGRVLKLEMQIEKGSNYVTMDDINNLMDLYTQAVEFYNCAQQADRQKYYETKLLKLLETPNIMKIYDKGPVVTESTTDRSVEEKKTAQGDEPVVKIFDKSATSPFN